MEYAKTATVGTRIAEAPLAQVGGMVNQYASDTELALAALHTALDHLYERLSPTLTIAPPNVSQTAGAPMPMASPFGERLRAQAVGVQQAVARVEELVLRLDL